MLATATNTVLVGRLRIRSRSADPHIEQQRVGRVLRDAALHPAGLPESALLVVRRLADPLPSRLRAGPSDTSPDPVWQQAVAARLDELRAAAATPAFGPVPASAAAVLFHDRAEVLTALALDWLAGNLSSQWWWRELLNQDDSLTALLREWVNAPQYVPAALDLLSRTSRAVSFVQRLPEHAAERIVEAVTQTHGLPRPSAEPTATSTPTGPLPANSHRSVELGPTGPSSPQSTPSIRETRRTGLPASSFAPPWISYVPEASTPALSPIQKRLLVFALMLRRAPTLARTEAIQRQILAYCSRSGMDERTHNLLPAIHAQAAAAPLIDKRQHDGSEPPLSNAPAKAGLKTAEQPEFSVPPASAASVTDSPLAHLNKSDATPVIPAADSPHSGHPTGAPMVRTDPRDAVPAAAKQPPTETATVLLASIDTEYGGVFFLLNVALYLGIYGDFSNPLNTGIDLDIWDFLSLIAESMIGSKIKIDPLWRLFASLTARPADRLPGEFFDPPDEWRLPPAWLDAFPEEFDQNPILIDGRLVCMHPAGFTVIDVPAEERELTCDARFQRWLNCMAQYFRARIVRAMGRKDAVALLCRAPARISFTMTHLDVSFSLDRHPIEVRFATLDRDPGWIPAAGRYVRFQFS
jgi:hypothetical protein